MDAWIWMWIDRFTNIKPSVKQHQEWCKDSWRLTMDWKHVLDNPDDYGWEELTDLAGDWDTCPVEEVPCDKEGEPQDDELFSLGMEFHTAVCDQKWSKAKDLLFLIEARIKEVLEI